jgi:hypothetical protein
MAKACHHGAEWGGAEGFGTLEPLGELLAARSLVVVGAGRCPGRMSNPITLRARSHGPEVVLYSSQGTASGALESYTMGSG